MALLMPLVAQNTQSPITVSPSQLTFNSTSSTPAPAQNLVVVSNNGSAVNFTVSGFPDSWLHVTPTSGTTPQVLSVSVSPGSMPAGAYGGFITITAGTSASNVPVILNVNSTGASTFTATPASLTFNFQTGSTVPLSQQVNIANTATANTTFTATSSASGGGSWLSVNPSSGTTPTGVTVSVNPSNLTSGSYSGAVAINAPGTTGLLIPVTVNVAAPSTVDVMPAQLSFAFQIGASAPAPQTLNITTTGGGTMAFSATPSTTTCGGNWLVVSPQNSATPSAVSVQINTTSLTAGNCTGTVNISAPGASNPTQAIPVSLLVSTSPLIQAPTTVPKFTYQLGTATPASQTVQITSSSTPLDFTVAATPVSGGPNFLKVSPASGTTPKAVTLSIDPTVLAGLAPNTYAENVTITSAAAGNPPQTFTVTLEVSNNPTIVLSQAAATFNYQLGQSAPTNQTITLTSTGAPLSYTVTSATSSCGDFLSATPASGITSVESGQQSQVVLSVDVSKLTTAQTCSGTVTISTGAGSTPVMIPVTLNVSSTPLLTVSPASVNVVAAVGSTAAVKQPISLVSTDAATALNFTATAVTNPAGLTWLSVSPQTGSTPASLQVTVDATGLAAGTYTGSINITSTSPNVPAVTIPVTLTVASGTIVVAPTTLSFSQPLGGTTPAAQTLQITGIPQGATVGATATMLNGTGWLTVKSSGATVTVNADGSKLSSGTYSGVITVFAPGAANSPFYVPVTFAVGGAPLFTLTPSTVSFTYQQNAALPPAQAVQIASASGSVPFNAVVVAAPGTTQGTVFITATPTSGMTPGTLTIGLNQSVVSTLSPGTYSNTVQLSSSPLGGTQPITVTLTVTSAGPPTVTAIVNAADFLAGNGVSPGELVTIFGSSIGPATPIGLQLTSGGAVATTLGATSVTFNGIAAPLIYVSANQINAIVPYEVTGTTSANVVIMNDNAASQSFQVNIVPTAPGIFASGQNGSGQGAILNQNLSLNESTNPAAAGTVIAIYATGEGQLTPAGVTASVTPSTGTNFPKPNAAVTVTIGGQPATVLYAGEAPGLVSGVLQVNAMVPAGLTTGNQPVVITVGGASSPSVVTAAIK